MSTSKIIVVGDPRLGTMLADTPAQWDIQTVQTSIGQMWDNIESGALDPDIAAIIITDGTSGIPDELESNLITFSSYCHTFLFADPARAQALIARAQELAPSIENSDPTAPIWVLPITDANQAIDIIRRVTSPNIVWEDPAPAIPMPTVAPTTQPMPHVAPAPSTPPQQVAPPPAAVQPAPQPATAPRQTYQPQTSAPQTHRDYDHSQAYGDHIVKQAQQVIAKLPNAIPGQMTIACMSSKGGSGKALDVNTPIPTPRGYIRMGDLNVGDYVYDEHGDPTAITDAYDTLTDRDCYEVFFRDVETGTTVGSIVADADHLWPVTRGGIPSAPATTKDLLDSLHSSVPGSPVYAGKVRTPEGQHLQYVIASILPVPTRPVRCISVNAASHVFLASEWCIPTHNSTTALCLAGTIAKASAAAGDPKRVVLVDLDTRDGQVGSLIGQFMPTALNVRVLPKWDAASVQNNLVHDKQMGIDALLAPVRPRNADDVGPEFYRAIIGVLQTTHDVVILDCSVNYLDPLLGVGFAMSDEILFVTTLATTSVQGMARSLTELFADPADGGLGIPQEKVGVVANQVLNNVGMGKDKLLRAALGAPIVGQIPSDQDAVLIATNSTKMSSLLKHPRLGPAYFKLASSCLPGWALAPLTTEQIQAQQPPGEDPGKKTGFFRR